MEPRRRERGLIHSKQYALQYDYGKVRGSTLGLIRTAGSMRCGTTAVG
jgi:hypothetical protein